MLSALGCGARTSGVDPIPPLGIRQNDASFESSGGDIGADAVAPDETTPDVDGGSRGDARFVDPDGSLFTSCGGKPCRGNCWALDECDCNGIAGGCPDYAVCCPGFSACVGSCR
jgi:hypothetical protein